MMNKKGQDGSILVLVAIVIVVVLVGGIFGLKSLGPWWAKKTGESELARAEQNRQIVILEAKAANEAATMNAEAKIKQETANAQAEIIRAKGVAEANTIIANSLKGNEAYLRYLWIDKLSDNQNVIYVPTESGLPILEAGKR